MMGKRDGCTRGEQQMSEASRTSKEREIRLLKNQLHRLNEIMKCQFDDPRVDAWNQATTEILNTVYGTFAGMHHKTKEVVFAQGLGSRHVNMPRENEQKWHEGRQQKQRALLEAYIEEFEVMFGAAGVVRSGCQLHPEIERVSASLFGDGHYKQAALEAYISVIAAVKRASGLPEDGDKLMGKAFSFDTQKPVLKFNSLETEPERDEQRGIMYLFKGLVGLRNSKAHSNRLFNDPVRAHDYLALASLLMRLLEISSKS